MKTLYLWDPRSPFPSPVNTPTTFVTSEALAALAAAVQRGRYGELWEQGQCTHRLGPNCMLPRR